MPRLLRLRFVSIGHPLARMDDLLLDLRDAEGRAADSTLWLRNGGGKSSILNLFFAILRPHKGEFLGGKADSRRRSLEDYVLAQDRAVTAAEWELDAPSGALDLGPERYVTGVFYERREGSRELRRLFFATRTADDAPDTAIDGLPLFVESGGHRSRRTLASFREAWLALRERAPHLGAAATESQVEWRSILDSARIDPDLFAYQVRMNLREGGADEMFRFDEPEEFVDFLLELALDPALAGQVGRNLATYRRELVLRRESLLPERELVAGLTGRFGPLLKVRTDRAGLRARLGENRAAISALEAGLGGHLQEMRAAVDAADREAAAHAEAAARARQEADGNRVRAALLRRHAAGMRLGRFEAELRQVEAEWRDADRRKRIWAAAVPLRRAYRAERAAAGIRQQLEERQSEHAPLQAALIAAAGRFAAALAWRAREHRDAERAARAEERRARDEARRCRDEAAAAQGRGSAAESDARHLEGRLAEIEAERLRLVRRGVVLEAESAGDAVARLGRTLAAHEAARERFRAEAGVACAGLLAVEESLESARRLLADLRTEAGVLGRRLDEASAERARLEADPVLAAAIEIEKPDLDRLGDEAVRTIEGRARQENQRAVDQRVAAAEGERAALHLAENGLLPPATDAERVLDVLRARLGSAWSGWSWISANVAKDRALAAVRAAPYLAQGVVVRPDDLARAAGILQEAGLTPAGPVVVASTEAFARPPDLPGVVFGPGDAAYYDVEAARRRLAALEVELEAVRREIALSERRHRELTACGETFRSFREQYAVGYFAAAREALARAEGSVGEAEAQIGILDRQRGEKRARLERLRGAIEDEAEKIRAAGAGLDAAQRFRELSAPVPEWRQQLASARRLATEAARDRSRWTEAAAREDGRAQLGSENAVRSAEDARAAEEEERKLPYVEGRAEPAPGPVDELRERFAFLRADYETKIGAEGLLALATHQEEQAREERARFRRLAEGASAGEDEVGAVLATLPDPDRVEEARQEAEEASGVLFGRVGNLNQRVATARDVHEKAVQECEGLAAGPDLDRPPETAEAADEEAAACDRRSAGALEDAAAAALEAEAAARSGEAARARARNLGIEAARLASLRENFADLLEQGAAAAAAAPDAAFDEDGLGARISGLEEDLRAGRARAQELDRNREAASRGLRVWLSDPRFERLTGTHWIQRLHEHEDQALEDRAGTLYESLELRLQHLDAQIADIERNRSILVEQVHAVADEGLKLLRSASSLSRLPDHVPGIGGAPFLRITVQAPEDPEERRARLAGLVDELVAGGAGLEGVALAQAAVRCLARPVQVRVLHPDPALERRTVSIPEMARFSGGEQLTGAILLYCTLARVRARSRGMSHRTGGVLILDNPIGRASRVRFLELQREVARAMGVQLVYTTAVNDHEALRALPNVIRLRNERIDRNSGHRLVEAGAEVERVIEAVRVGRRDGRPPAATSAPADGASE